MRVLATVRRLVARVRVAPEPTHSAGSQAGRRTRRRRVPKGHVAPPVPTRPVLAPHVPRFVQIERDVLARFRPLMQQAIQDAIEAAALALEQGAPQMCCGQAMRRHDRRWARWLTWVGSVGVKVCRYRCKACRARRRPLLEYLGVEPGQPSGLLARTLGLLGCVSPYALAAELTGQLLGVKVNAMTVWRAVQRLGEAAARYTESQSAYHADSRSEAPDSAHAPDAVVVAVDGCALGMQVRTTRRRRKTSEEILPPLEEGHFREVKSGVLLLPTQRVQPSPGRRALVRRVLVTCLGDADAIFSRLWAQLRERAWLGANTQIVIVGDGSEWIWKRAALFVKRCEILDFWHALEYGWAYARPQFGQDSRRANAWALRLARDLKAGKVLAVIARLKTLQPVSDESAAALQALIKLAAPHFPDPLKRRRRQSARRSRRYLRRGGRFAIPSSPTR